MNILILTPFNPYPPVQGGKIRIFNIIKNISKSHRVSLVSIVDDASAEDVTVMREFCEEVMLIERPAQLWKDRYRFLVGNKPYNVVRYVSDKVRQALTLILKRKKFDLVQIEFSMMWQYADLFKGTAVILDAHNIEHEIIHAVGKTFRNPLRKLSYFFEEKRLREVEERAWRESSLCFTVSGRECDTIQQTIGQTDKVVTIPNGVDLQRFVFQPINYGNTRILFIGGLDYIPNLDSAQYFLSEIFPLIRLQIPNVELNIVGRELWRIRNNPPLAGIEFHENVPDVLPYFRKADILVVPLRYGAGTRIKILEAMAAGLPVVTTSKGCEGLEMRHGEHLLIADSPEEFAHAVHKLLKDIGLRAYITKNARHLVEQKYSWEIIVSDIEKHYEKIVNSA